MIGGFALIGIVVLGVFLWRRRGKHQSPTPATIDMCEEQHTIPYDYNPHIQDPETDPFRQAQSQSQSSIVRPAMPPVQGGMILSSKAREAARNPMNRILSDRVASGPSSDTPISSRDTPETSSSNAIDISAPSVQGLRTEVENLRRAMEEMKADRMEAPPGYHDI